MIPIQAKIVGITLMIGFAISFGLFCYNFVVMLAGVKQEKKRIIQFLGPFAFFLSELYDDIGNRARVRAIIYILLAIIFVAAAFITIPYLNQAGLPGQAGR
jgi:hypothetical protein